MPEYKVVKAARHAGTKPNPHGGVLHKWYVDWEDGPEDCYWQNKREQVTPGEKAYGHVEAGEYNGKTTYRFFTDPEQPSQTPSAPAQSQASYEVIRGPEQGSKDATPLFNTEDARQASIIAQSMFKAAAEIVAAEVRFLDDAASEDLVVRRVTSIGDKLIAEVNARGRRAGGAL